MRPNTGLSNSKLNYTTSKLRNISALSSYDSQSRLAPANKQGFTKSTSLRKPPTARPQPDPASLTNIQPKTPVVKKNTRNLSQSQFHNLNLGNRLLETMDAKDNSIRPSPMPKSASRPHLNYTSNYKQPRLPVRAQNNKVIAELDENTSINRIPVSPISVKMSVNQQMGSSLAELHERENMWTEGATLDLSGLNGLQSPNLASTYTIKRNSSDVHENKHAKTGHFSTRSFQISLPSELDSLKAFSKTIDSKQYNSTLNKKLQSPSTFVGDGETNFEKEADSISCMSSNQLFSTMQCHSMADVNQGKSLQMQSSAMLESETKDSIMKSPRLSHQKNSNEAPLKVRQPNVENVERTSLKSSVMTQSSPKSKLVNGNIEHSRVNSKLENVKTYLSKFDISNSTTIIKQIFQPKKRLRCSCDSGLDEDQTCSRALGWLKKKYNPNEFEYLKATYEKIVCDSKADNADQLKQIQKDVYRTYPNNKFFAPDSPGLKSLQTVLNAFANYDPQIGYVQGMNFIGASLLYHAEEYITFWLLVMIFEIFEMRDIYLPKLPGLSKHCQIIDMLIFNYEHRLYLHLCQHEIKVEIFCTEWILALFASVIPVENMANFYEILLQEGWPFFYKIILAFLRQFEKQILEQDELLGILTVLKSQNHLIKNFAKDKNKMNLDWNALFQKAQKIEIDSHFIYKMHSNFDMDNQWFRTSFLQK